jgi:ribonuclease HII
MQPSFLIENQHWGKIICGIDEAGRGPLAGPVVAACVILNQNNLIAGINDSKKLSKAKRQKLFAEICKNHQFAIGIVEAKIIDEINILQATKLAMLKAFENLQKKYQIFPEIILVDGNFSPFAKSGKISEILPIIKGDSKSLSIAAASIIAKETRDEIMLNLHQEFPVYNFNKHAGYPTKSHIQAIKDFGICAQHRQTFQPIKSM